MPSWIQDPNTGKLIPKEEYYASRDRTYYIQGDIEQFVSPVDGSVISDRRALREHNRRNNVVPAGAYGENEGAAYYARKKKEREQSFSNPAAKRERRDAINRAIEKVKNGYRPNLQEY